MHHLLNQNGHYYFNRRVPLYLKAYDTRQLVRVALRTDSKKEAHRLAIVYNDHVEEYWRTLVRDNKQHSVEAFEQHCHKLRLSELIGDTTVKPNNPTLIRQTPKDRPITIEQGLSAFWGYARGKTVNKSPNQLRKWRTPRKAAITNLIRCIGNKPMQEVTRADILKFRDWWLSRIEKENLGSNAANKNFIQAKVVFETVNENMDLGIDTKHLFKKLLLKENWETTRRPFETDFIRDVLLKPDNLSGLHPHARWILCAIAETGAGLAEQLGLQPEDIHLDYEIPYIEIIPRQKKALKTRYRKRTIPLVGYALDAFEACPQGFTRYNDRPDGLSGVLNKYLRDINLLPTPQHSLYSLRHSFQDRLLAANAPDRVQADLMGHKLNRQAYGNGASLEQKLEWLEKTQLKINSKSNRDPYENLRHPES